MVKLCPGYKGLVYTVCDECGHAEMAGPFYTHWKLHDMIRYLIELRKWDIRSAGTHFASTCRDCAGNPKPDVTHEEYIGNLLAFGAALMGGSAL